MKTRPQSRGGRVLHCATIAGTLAPAVQTLTHIRTLLESRGLSPRKSLGQNFLTDQNLLRKLVDASRVAPGDIVLEIGPGTGVLTQELLARGCSVVACELDPGLAELIRDTFADAIRDGRLTLIEGDCLVGKSDLNPGITASLARLGASRRGFRLVANLPYGVASPLIVVLLTLPDRSCRGVYATIQREVADRLRARPGSSEYGELSVLVGAMAEVSRIAVAPPECFWPRPKVTSEMVSILPREHPLTSDPRDLARICRVLFTKRRKQLGTILGRQSELPEGIDASMRPGDLSIEQLEALARSCARSIEGQEHAR